MPGKWWRALEDRKLEKLVNDALDDNFNLKTAWDRLDQARAVARKQRASLWPQLDGSGSGSRTVQESEGASFITQSTIPQAGGGAERTYSDEFTLGLSARYEVDLWGRVQAASDAAELSARASAQDVRAAALSLSGQVANTWYRLVTQRAQLELLKDQVETNRRYLRLVRLRFNKGNVSATDVLQQRKLLDSTRTDRARARAELETLEHQLAVLLGKPPGNTDVPGEAELPDLPPLPDTGVPARWLRRRPDLRSAYLRVRSADRQVAAAIADQYPRVSISANYQTTAAEPSELLQEWFASLAGNMTAPILDGGRREAEVDRTRAAAAEALHNYGQTLLTGIRDVEDALSSERQQRDVLKRLRKQLRLSDRTVEQLLRKYRNGTVDFLRVLDELRTHQQLQRSVLSARYQLVQDRINLYRALGGTWNLDRPEGTAGTSTTGSTVQNRARSTNDGGNKS
ncbi:MAG: efflux transporter outer membrane subunit [Planctomycetota bacterium]